MKVVNSLKSMKGRHKNFRIVRRKGRLYISSTRGTRAKKPDKTDDESVGLPALTFVTNIDVDKNRKKVSAAGFVYYLEPGASRDRAIRAFGAASTGPTSRRLAGFFTDEY